MSFASIGDYRRETMLTVTRALGPDLTIYAGTTTYDPSIVTLRPQDVPFIELRNRYLPGNILLQQLPWVRLLSVDSLLLDLNPRMPQVWILTMLRRVARKRTVLWGHAWPRSGRHSRSEVVRGALRKVADGLVAYTYGQAGELSKSHPGKEVYCAPNSLFYESEMRFNHQTNRTAIVYVGRMHCDKKPMLLLRAFADLAPKAPSATLQFVGAGPELAELKATAITLNLDDRVTFHGHVTDRDKLRNIYDHAFVAASPGYVGLSVTQAFSFGVPMVISRDEPHAPEYESAEPETNCRLFRTDETASLAEEILTFWNDRECWKERGPTIAAACATKYSVEKMAEGLIASLTNDKRTR